MRAALRSFTASASKLITAILTTFLPSPTPHLTTSATVRAPSMSRMYLEPVSY